MIVHSAIDDGVELPIRTNGQEWLVSWHPPPTAPVGTAHGAAGVCITDSGEVMLVSHDGIEWDWPAGRTEGDETWELTLRREILEEVCATVVDARLLGFCRSVCIAGREADLVLVRSFWRARVVPGSGGGVVFRQVFRNAEYVAATDARTDARGAFGWP